MPGVEDGVAAFGHEEHAEVGLTGSEHAWHTMFVHQAYEMNIVGKFAARHERPAATQPEPTSRGRSTTPPACIAVPVSRSMRHRSLLRIACTIGSAIRRSF